MKALLRASAITLASVSCAFAVAHAVGKTANTELIPAAVALASGPNGWKNHSDRCRRIKSKCIEQCISTLPTRDHGVTFQRCVNECLKKNRCVPTLSEPGEKR
ncbi:hypothetical protein [Burkholderia sp. WSM2232]|uniref:hypothetical protein n=1 Tax=Burkholderia sp. WSM2232 TaxID=944436 RepID=UPI0012EC338C|nr:hypothetical protein [Burkholderia sp. WSM2232]